MDAAWIEQWIEEWGDTIARFALSYTQDRALAQDIAQETFWRLHQWHQAHPQQHVHGGWLFTTAHRLVIDERRRRRETPSEHVAEFRVSSERPLDQDVTQRLAVQQILDQMSDVDRECLWLFYYRAWTVAEIARAQTLSETAVRSRLHRERQRFAQLWKEDHDAE